MTDKEAGVKDNREETELTGWEGDGCPWQLLLECPHPGLPSYGSVVQATFATSSPALNPLAIFPNSLRGKTSPAGSPGPSDLDPRRSPAGLGQKAARRPGSRGPDQASRQRALSECASL